jgi:hypothetical protein
VCLDNAETPWEADPLGTEDLFGKLAEVAGLVVSFRGAERPGGVSWQSPLRLTPLSVGDSRAIFLSIAGEKFDLPALGPLLAEMGGVPLAIELLAYAAEGESSLENLAGRWRAERVKLLRRGSGKHRLLSVAVSVEASWVGRLMTEPARRLLTLLGRLPDGIAEVDIEALLPRHGRDAAGTLRRRGLAFHEAGRLRTYSPVRHHIHQAHPPLAEDWRRATAHYRELARLGRKVGG